MSFLVAITVFSQVFFIAHAIYGNRPFWWALIILAFPVVGCIAYFIVEVLPEAMNRQGTQRSGDSTVQSISAAPVASRATIEELTHYGSAQAKIAQGELCLNAGAFQDAVKLFESCVAGVHANDPHLLVQLARAYLLDGQCERSISGIERIQVEHPAYRPQEIKLLLARALEGQHSSTAALAVYQDLAETYVGFEAKARYALFLKALGKTGQARVVFNLIVGQARRASALIDSEKKWVRLAYNETMPG